MKLALVQAPAGQVIAANLAALEDYIGRASLARCQAVCFPECFLTGYAPERAAELAIGAQDEALGQVARLAKAHGIDVLAGFMEREGRRLYITQGLFRADGTADFYRKTHLGRKEEIYFTPGDRLEVFSLSSGRKVGVALCLEAHFPELIQTLALRGAEVIFAPHASPRAAGDRLALWKRYIPARSYDNRVYMACCNLWDPERFSGGCLVTDPCGEVLAQVGDGGPELVCFTADPAQTAALRDPCRRGGFYPAHRRKELYD